MATRLSTAHFHWDFMRSLDKSICRPPSWTRMCADLDVIVCLMSLYLFEQSDHRLLAWNLPNKDPPVFLKNISEYAIP